MVFDSLFSPLQTLVFPKTHHVPCIGLDLRIALANIHYNDKEHVHYIIADITNDARSLGKTFFLHTNCL